MRQATIIKTASVTAEDLEKINRWTRRPLDAAEVYCFSLILCDNEIDRDGECFPTASLEKLAELFLGKTGLFDHEAKASGQTARIFDTEVIQDSARRSQSGEVYHALKARAYLMRSEKTEPLILEIDGGIKKEVSVGCSVRAVRCSICGAELRHEGCEHRIGEEYGGKRCFAWLEDPADAYEWSFVAIPAQPNAGVIKQFAVQRPLSEVEQALKGEGAVTLSKSEARELALHLQKQEELAREGGKYRTLLMKQVQKLSALCGSGPAPELLQKALERMNTPELAEYLGLLEQRAGQCRFGRQLAPEAEEQQTDQTNESFKI